MLTTHSSQYFVMSDDISILLTRYCNNIVGMSIYTGQNISMIRFLDFFLYIHYIWSQFIYLELLNYSLSFNFYFIHLFLYRYFFYFLLLELLKCKIPHCGINKVLQYLKTTHATKHNVVLKSRVITSN